MSHIGEHRFRYKAKINYLGYRELADGMSETVIFRLLLLARQCYKCLTQILRVALPV